MNEERLIKIEEDMAEVIKNLIGCRDILESTAEKDKAIFIEFGLKRILEDFFVLVQNFTSTMLKEWKQFMIGMDIKDSLTILKSRDVIDEDIYLFLNQIRLLRNRISHRYKEPSRQDLI